MSGILADTAYRLLPARGPASLQVPAEEPVPVVLKRGSRTTYRPTVTPEGSTHVDSAFTGTTSSFSRTASGKVAVVAVVRQRVLAEVPRPDPASPHRTWSK